MMCVQKVIFSSLLRSLIILTVLLPVTVTASGSPTPSLVVALQPDVFITEVQTATTASASEEFVELFNNTDHDIDFADASHGGKDIWKLQYFSGSKLSANGVTDWAKPTGTIDLSTMSTTIIAAHDYYLLASTKTDGSVYQPGNIEADGHYSAKLSDNIGLQLVDVASTTAVTTAHDRVVWQQTANVPAVLQAPPAGSSLQRLPNTDSEYIDSEGHLTSFNIESQISPKDIWQPPSLGETDESDPPAEPLPSSDDTATGNTQSLQHPIITELLPNPAPPQTDANDEFIELYNPNPVTFDLSGYTLETGSSTLHDFTFSNSTTLPPMSYQAYYSVDTHLSLSNSGGQVRLLDHAKLQVDQSETYTTATDGKAWALFDTAWQWTSTPTPDLANILAGTAGPGSLKIIKTSKAVKGVNTTRTVTKTTKNTKITNKAKKPKAPKTASTKQPANSLAATIRPTPIHVGVLAAVACGALLYACYEYRTDLANYFYRLRSHHSFGRKHRS